MLCDGCSKPIDSIEEPITSFSEINYWCDICSYAFCDKRCSNDHKTNEHSSRDADPLAFPDDPLVDAANRILKEGGGVNGYD